MRRRKKKRRQGRSIRFCIIVLLIPLTGLAGWFGLSKALPHLPEKVQETVCEFRVPFEELTVSEEEVTGGYYYQQLNEEEQTIYKEILQGVSKRAKTIYVHTGDYKMINKVYDFLLYDRPELFWCTGELETTYYPTYSELAATYNCTEEECLMKQEQIETETENALQQFLSDWQQDAADETFAAIPEYERAKFVFEYLVNSVDYVKSAPDNQNLYSALVGKQSVCAGYARAAQYLLKRLGLDCIYLTGTAGGEAHAWNLVKCDENWYHLDVTYGDPEHMQTTEGEMLADSEIDYSYLCCTDEQIFRERTVDALAEYPACVSLDCNYYVLHGRYYDSYDPQRVLADMNQDTYNGAKKFFCQFASEELRVQAYQDMEANLFGQAAQTFLDFHGLRDVEYYYVENPVMNTIELYWNE